jgi:CBS domain-containing protein
MTTTLQPYRGSPLIPPFPRASVADVMRPGLLSSHADAPITEVADTMATYRIHAVAVAGIRTDAVHGEELVWGLISDLDLARAAGGNLEGRVAADFARTEAVTVEATTPLREAASMMAEHGTSHLIVARDGRPIGMVSGLDVAAAIAWGGGG